MRVKATGIYCNATIDIKCHCCSNVLEVRAADLTRSNTHKHEYFLTCPCCNRVEAYSIAQNEKIHSDYDQMCKLLANQRFTKTPAGKVIKVVTEERTIVVTEEKVIGDLTVDVDEFVKKG